MSAPVASSPAPAAVWKALARKLSQPGRDRMKVFDPETKEYLKTRRISDTVPTLMAAVYLYTQRRTTLLALDFDSKTHGREQVDADFERARGWLLSCGAALITDRSTNGGRHILVPLAIGTTASFDELQPLLRQLQTRLPSLDIKPMQNPNEGCISLPGTPCSGGGYRALDGSITAAVNAATERSSPTLLPELYALMGTLPAAPTKKATAAAAAAHTTGAGDDECLVPGACWTKPIPSEVAAFALRGVMPPGRWRSPSEARMSVVTNAVLRGSSLAQIRDLTRPGAQWSALGDSYRAKHGTRADAQLARDVRSALTFASTQAAEANRAAHRFNYSQRGVAVEGPLGRWLAYAFAWTDREFAGSPLRWSVRDVYQSLAIKAAVAGELKSGNYVVGVGGRSLSLSAALMPPTTAFDVLRRTRDMVGAPLVRVRPRVGRDADFYALTSANPDNIAAVPLERVQVGDVHPAWSILGRQHRLVYELVVHCGLNRPADIYAAARISPRSGQFTLAALTTAGLIVRVGRTVAQGPVSLDDIAAAYHLDEVQEDLIARYRRERAAWHDWLAVQDQLKGLAPVASDDSPTPTPPHPVFADEDEYLSAVLAHGPPDVPGNDELAALELLGDLLGARILTPAGR